MELHRSRLARLTVLLAWGGAASVPPARAQEVDYEKLALLGWNKACSVAVVHNGYPPLGYAAVSDPVTIRVGRLFIPSGAVRAQTDWRVNLDGYYAFQPDEMRNAEARLKKEGHRALGYREVIRPDKIGPQPGLEELLRSTAALDATAPSGWPSDQYRLAEILYSPLSTCALLVYTYKDFPKPFYSLTLTRVNNARARVVRSRAHVSNARLLLDSGDTEGALAETRIAAAMAPGYGLARYHHAALLSLSGDSSRALDELDQAIRLDPKYKEEAREDRDFEVLRDHPRFKELTLEPRKRKKKF